MIWYDRLAFIFWSWWSTGDHISKFEKKQLVCNIRYIGHLYVRYFIIGMSLLDSGATDSNAVGLDSTKGKSDVQVASSPPVSASIVATHTHEIIRGLAESPVFPGSNLKDIDDRNIAILKYLDSLFAYERNKR